MRVPTMVPKWVCVIVLPSSKLLHGSAFPDRAISEDFDLKYGNMALRIVLYTTQSSLNLAKRGSVYLKTFMKSWKSSILSLDKPYQWRHVAVFNSVCNKLDQDCNYLEERIVVESK